MSSPEFQACGVSELVDVVRFADGLAAHDGPPHNRAWYEARRQGLIGEDSATGRMLPTDAGRLFLARHDSPLIYVAHPTGYDYVSELYQPLRCSELDDIYRIVLPHEHDRQPAPSRPVIAKADVLVAEITWPSTGLGIELAWADVENTPIVAVHRAGSVPSRSVRLLTDRIAGYDSPACLVAVVAELIGGVLADSIAGLET